MEISLILMVSHSLSALGLLVLCFIQYKWKKDGRKLKGFEREKKLKIHEEVGRKLLLLLSFVIFLAILGNLISGLNSGKTILKSIIPRSPHGTFGFIGATLFYYTWKLGIKTKASI